MKKILMITMMVAAFMMFMSAPAMAESIFDGAKYNVEFGAAKVFSISHSMSAGDLGSKIDQFTLTSPREQILFRFEAEYQLKNGLFVRLKDYALTGNILDSSGEKTWGISKNVLIGSIGYMITKNIGIQTFYSPWMSRIGSVKEVSNYVGAEVFVRFGN